jgi:4-diphosphocytidyl-2-C-methyl-D-erythritol kinase
MNSFEGVVFELYPELGDLKMALLQAGADGAVLSGSGASLVALCRSQDRLRAVTRYCDTEAITCYVSEASRAGV